MHGEDADVPEEAGILRVSEDCLQPLEADPRALEWVGHGGPESALEEFISQEGG